VQSVVTGANHWPDREALMSWQIQPGQRRWLQREGDRLLDFARAARHPNGGFAWLDDCGRPQLQRPVELWITCRMTHVFALGKLLGRPGNAQLVDHGLRALLGPLHDQVNGGWYSTVGAAGPIDRSKQTYSHAFVVLAASSATKSGHPLAPQLLDEALEVMDTRMWSENDGMVFDTYDETFTELSPYRGLNANMHTVEAFLAASDVTGDPKWRDRALRITERVLNTEAPQSNWRLVEHFDATWQPQPDYNIELPDDPFRPFGATVGHALEWSRLALNLRAALGAQSPQWLLTNAIRLFDRAVQDGWAADGQPGFVYTTDWDGKPVVRHRMHWVAAEATAAAASLYRATGDERFAQFYEQWWDFINEKVRDEVGGSWWHELDELNQPSAKIWSGKPDVYHALQATLIPRLPLSPSLATALHNGLLPE
jgi:mannose/cellobiose epimerase-like protein (N-acyl-D-glucosamine 2-epimerase family)